MWSSTVIILQVSIKIWASVKASGSTGHLQHFMVSNKLLWKSVPFFLSLLCVTQFLQKGKSICRVKTNISNIDYNKYWRAFQIFENFFSNFWKRDAMFDTVEGYKKKIDNAKAAYRVSKHVFSVSSLRDSWIIDGDTLLTTSGHLYNN